MDALTLPLEARQLFSIALEIHRLHNSVFHNLLKGIVFQYRFVDIGHRFIKIIPTPFLKDQSCHIIRMNNQSDDYEKQL